MSDDFDPYNLDHRSSLNSTRLADNRGVEPGARGRQASEFLSQHALSDAVRAHAGDLGLDPRRPDADLVRALESCSGSTDEAVRLTAARVVARFGSYLAYLVLTLTMYSDTALPGSRQWKSVRDLWLGGGIVSGRLGPPIADAAQRLLANAESPVSIRVARYPDLLPLIGAARSVGLETAAALVLDFGGGSAKHGFASYEGGPLKSLDVLPPVAVPPMPPDIPPLGEERAMARHLADFVTAVISQDLATAEERSTDLGTEICVSLACYLKDNHPLDYPAVGYMSLRHIGANAGQTLSREASARAGRPLSLTLIHDGTAAGRALAGERADAVVMLGTWLGLGFVPRARHLRALDPGFRATRLD